MGEMNGSRNPAREPVAGATPADLNSGCAACAGGDGAAECPVTEATQNIGLCNTCQARVPATFVLREGQVWIRKDCPTCGATESLVSSDAAIWQGKRDLWQYVPVERVACKLNCDKCRIPHNPSLVFLDVTNRCNMNCPICIATIKGMGFEYHPPLEYFEKVFEHVGQFRPRPMVELFGGEPTMHPDLLEIIAIARRNGLKAKIVTNGVRLADEDYCRELCESNARVNFAFDGRSPEIYERLRRNRWAYEKKMQGLENLKKYSRRKQSIIACCARGINDDYMGDLIQMCHEFGGTISELGVIPLTENWPEGEFEVQERTTMEDVEKILAESVAGGNVEFVPAGFVYGFRKARPFFRGDSPSETLILGGVHPNCESVALLASDGEQYRSLNHFLKMPLSKVAAEVLRLTRRIEPKLDRLDPKNRWDRLRGQLLILRTFTPLAFRALDVNRYTKDRPLGTILRILAGLARGERDRDVFYRHLKIHRVLRLAVLPFEEAHSIDGARMENCKAVFAYENVETGEIETIPACTWYLYRNPILKGISEKYGVVGKAKADGGDPKAGAERSEVAVQ